MLRFIARQRGIDPEPHQDYDFTDYRDLRGFLLLRFPPRVERRLEQTEAAVAKDTTSSRSLPEQVWAEEA